MLLRLADAEPDGAPTDLVAAVIAGIEDGPVTLVAGERDLSRSRLGPFGRDR